jgi:hypothetical protein
LVSIKKFECMGCCNIIKHSHLNDWHSLWEYNENSSSEHIVKWQLQSNDRILRQVFIRKKIEKDFFFFKIMNSQHNFSVIWDTSSEKKVKFVSVHVLKSYRGSRGMTQLILNLGCRRLVAPAALSPEKNFGKHWKWGWVGPRTGRDNLEKIKIYCYYSDQQMNNVLTIMSISVL